MSNQYATLGGLGYPSTYGSSTPSSFITSSGPNLSFIKEEIEEEKLEDYRLRIEILEKENNDLKEILGRYEKRIVKLEEHVDNVMGAAPSNMISSGGEEYLKALHHFDDFKKAGDISICFEDDEVITDISNLFKENE